MPPKPRCCISNRPSTLFARELRDLDFVFESDLETISSTQRALDIFFDNLFSDWGTKVIIEKNIENLKKLQDSTEDVMESLAAKKRELETTLEVLADEDNKVV